MEWSGDDNSWLGSYNGFKFAISRSRKHEQTPIPELLQYANNILKDRNWLERTLVNAKKAAKAEKQYGKHYSQEIDELVFGLINFYMFKDKLQIIADLAPGKELRAWRIEYYGHHCEGIGFDS
jgi:hypothetical protein